ncbi:cell division protein FtsH, partial [Enterococcus lactis]
IEQHREQHKVIADALLKYETLDEKEILSLYCTGKMPEENTSSDDEDASFEESKEQLEQKENQHQDNDED